jgi:ADP-ribose pyrophosphatase YjhB (NUDIX family)
VLRGDRILLIERRTAGRSWWQIPGGYVEIDEAIHVAIEREVLEETGVTAQVRDVVGFRHAAGLQPERPASNIYVVFCLDAIAGEPRPDGEESFAAGFFSRSEMTDMPGISAMSMWAIDKAANASRASGLLHEEPPEGFRPGATIFGVGPSRGLGEAADRA